MVTRDSYQRPSKENTFFRHIGNLPINFEPRTLHKKQVSKRMQLPLSFYAGICVYVMLKMVELLCMVDTTV